MLRIITTALTLFILFSCTKDQTPDRYIGDYQCTVKHTQVTLGEPLFDTTYNEIFSVVKEEAMYQFYNERIHEDAVDIGEEFLYSYGSGAYLSVRFEVDSLYIDYKLGGLGFWSRWEYSGRRIQ